MQHRITLLAVLLLVSAATATAQPPVEQTGTDVRLFDSNVRSLRVAPLGNAYLPPIITLGGNDRIRINFDYLDYDVHYLRYSVVHCDAHWRPSQLLESEYIDGFNYADIDNYAQSEATFAHYFNYDFVVPNDNMRLLLSGNYLLRVGNTVRTVNVQ